MANFAMEMHPVVWTPGALRPAMPAVYPVVQLVERTTAVPGVTSTIGTTGSVGAACGTTVPTAATHPQSDFTRKRLSIWQPNPAFAPRHPREEP